MRKGLKIVAILTLMAVLLRGIIYRVAVRYERVGERQTVGIRDEKLLRAIDSLSAERGTDLKAIAEVAALVTRKKLRFTTGKAEKDPNKLIYTGRANCVGYSAMFQAVAEYLIEKHGRADDYRARHLVGRLWFSGINLHKLFGGAPFFKDHDFNELLNLKTGEKLHVDPTVDDYLRISAVSVIN